MRIAERDLVHVARDVIPVVGRELADEARAPDAFSTESLLSTPGWIAPTSCGSRTTPLCPRVCAQPASSTAAAMVDRLQDRKLHSKIPSRRASGRLRALPSPAPQYAGGKERRKLRLVPRNRAWLSTYARFPVPRINGGAIARRSAVRRADRRSPAAALVRRGKVPDTLDGRFAVLATVTALALVGLERDGEDGNACRWRLRSASSRSWKASIASWALAIPRWARRCASSSACSRGEPICGGRPNRRARLGRSDKRKPLPGRGRRRCAEHQRRGAAASLASGSTSADARRPRTGENRMSDRFAHQLRLDQVRDGERLDLIADDAERAGIAKRLGSAIARPPRSACRPGTRPATSFAPTAGSPPPSSRAAPSPASRSRRMSTSRSRCSSCRNRRSSAPDEEIELGESDRDTSSTTAR